MKYTKIVILVRAFFATGCVKDDSANTTQLPDPDQNKTPWILEFDSRTLLKDPVAFTDVLDKIQKRWERSVTIVTVPHGPAVPRPDYTHIPSQTPGSSIVKHYPKHEDNQNGLHVTQRVGLYNPKDLHDVIVQIKNP